MKCFITSILILFYAYFCISRVSFQADYKRTIEFPFLHSFVLSRARRIGPCACRSRFDVNVSLIYLSFIFCNACGRDTRKMVKRFIPLCYSSTPLSNRWLGEEEITRGRVIYERLNAKQHAGHFIEYLYGICIKI